jgi:glycosyltransferase involved in cell wall biosynthesis
MKISVIMVAYNAEKYISEAIVSVIKQSFIDFEFIIIDDGSTDKTLSIIRLYKDKRIVLIESEHNKHMSLNKGLHAAKGKYIALMNANALMHIDRLKIQYSIMEEEQSITVCSSWMQIFGENIKPNTISKLGSGIIENPLLQLLNENFVAQSTAMIQKNFILSHNLQFENYKHAEDYKLWTEMAKLSANFYVESQLLVDYRIDNQYSDDKKRVIQTVTYSIKDEIIDYFIEQSITSKKLLKSTEAQLRKLLKKKLINNNEISKFFFSLISKNMNTLIRYK